MLSPNAGKGISTGFAPQSGQFLQPSATHAGRGQKAHWPCHFGQFPIFGPRWKPLRTFCAKFSTLLYGRYVMGNTLDTCVFNKASKFDSLALLQVDFDIGYRLVGYIYGLY